MMWGFKNKAKANPYRELKNALDDLIVTASKAGVSQGEIGDLLSEHVVSINHRALMRREQRQYGNNVISGNLPE
jgi:hypothetical protein